MLKIRKTFAVHIKNSVLSTNQYLYIISIKIFNLKKKFKMFDFFVYITMTFLCVAGQDPRSQ